MNQNIADLADDECRFPREFLLRYEPLECLADNVNCETLYVKDKQRNRFAIAKCYFDKMLLSSYSEGTILKSLQHDRVPHFFDEYESDTCLCVVREYIEGMPLNEWLNQHSTSERETIDFMIQLCDILIYLHSHIPPIIHRDIKPQNIIIANDNQLKLIDFGNARAYFPDMEEDTVPFGTRGFAPPEQYGFCQTDCRADIYSMGIVMGWMLTGEMDASKVVKALGMNRLARIYKKSTAFSPDQRYSSVSKMKRKLAKIKKNEKFVENCKKCA